MKNRIKFLLIILAIGNVLSVNAQTAEPVNSNYLFEKPEPDIIRVSDVGELLVFDAIIKPIFKKKCTSCHNNQKLKGELNLTHQEGIMKGGASGLVLDNENPGESLILNRIQLPKSDEDHMPPKGKVQLSVDELQLIQWWIEGGAGFGKKVSDLKKDEKINRLKAERYKTRVQHKKLKSIKTVQI